MFDEKIEVINSVPISYAVVGGGPKNILLITGAPGSLRTDYTEVLNELDHEKYTIVAFDLPAYGHSGPLIRDVSDGYNQRDGQVGHDLMKRLNLLPYSVLGWSDGGLAALFLAHEHRYTKLVEKLVVWGVPLIVDDQLAKIFRQIRTMTSQTKKPFLKIYSEERLDELWQQQIDGKLELHKNRKGDCGCRGILPEITCPTLVIHGDVDVIIPQSQNEMIHKAVKNSKFLICPKGGHDLHIKWTNWFKNEVERFLQS